MVLRYALLLGVFALGFAILAALLPSLLFAALALSGATLGVAVIARQRRQRGYAPAPADLRWISPAALWQPLSDTHQVRYPIVSLLPPPAAPRPLAPPVTETRRLAREIAGTVRALAALNVVVELSDDGHGQAGQFVGLWESLTAAAHTTSSEGAESQRMADLAAELIATDATADIFPADDSGAGEAFIALFGRLEGLVASATQPADPPRRRHAAARHPGVQRT